MKFSVDLSIETTENVSDSVLAQLPAEEDERVHAESVYQVSSAVPSGDTATINAAIRCNDESDQIAIVDSVLALSGMLDQCEVETRISLHDCTHDGSGGPCVVQTVYEVVL